MRAMFFAGASVRFLLGLGAIMLIITHARRERSSLAVAEGKSPSSPKALWCLALVAVVFYFDAGVHPKLWVPFHVHEFFHYYLGSKYSPEVGYENLYPSAVVADWENHGHELSVDRYRRMDDYGHARAQDAVDHADEYRARFTPERWEAFKTDVAFFRESFLDQKRWQRAVTDKGYNATPVWNMIARIFSNTIPIGHRWGICLLASLDLALLLVMFACVYWAFGLRTMLLAVVFLGSMFMMTTGHIRAAFLRLDWLAMLVVAICMLKREKYASAGLCAAYAVGARIFPAIFVFGIGAKALWVLLAERRIDRKYVAFFAAFGGGVLALVACSVCVGGGLGQWEAFLTKIRLHDLDIGSMRVGFRYIFLMAYANTYENWSAFEAAKLAQFQDRQLAWWGIQVAVLAASFLAARKLEDYEALAFGYVPFFFLTAPTFYYHVAFLVPLFLFVPKLGQPGRAAGAVLLFAVSEITFGLSVVWKLGLTLSFILSCLLLATCLYMAVLACSSREEPGLTYNRVQQNQERPPS